MIIPITKIDNYCKLLRVYRYNFGLNISFCRTTHACQGITCDRIIYVHGKQVRDKDLAYVALSRCKRFDGIITVHFDKKKFNTYLDTKTALEYSRLI